MNEKACGVPLHVYTLFNGWQTLSPQNKHTHFSKLNMLYIFSNSKGPQSIAIKEVLNYEHTSAFNISIEKNISVYELSNCYIHRNCGQIRHSCTQQLKPINPSTKMKPHQSDTVAWMQPYKLITPISKIENNIWCAQSGFALLCSNSIFFLTKKKKKALLVKTSKKQMMKTTNNRLERVR